MERVLITGAGGFIGSHLAEKFVREGYQVRAFTHYNSRNNWGWLEQSPIQKEMEILSGDVRDFDSIAAAMKGCQGVLHLAALIGIPYSYVSPLAYIRTNVEGTYNILQAAKECGVGNVLVTSTSETYGTAQYVPIDEKHPSVGQSPYSASKIAADQLALSYFRSFGLPVKIVRPFNTYGPRQSARAIIPTIIIQVLNRSKKLKLGNLGPTRDLTFVLDTVNGFMEIYKTGALFGEAINIGMNEEISVAELAAAIQECLGTDLPIETTTERVRPGASEVERLRCDNTKLREKTGWKPQYDMKKGLERTIDWLKENAGIYKADIYNV